MGNILNCYAIFSQSWKYQKAEAKAFGSRSLKLQSIDGLFESTKFEKVKGSNIDKYVQKKYFSYMKFFKSCGYPDLVFIIVFIIIFINSIYQPCITS